MPGIIANVVAFALVYIFYFVGVFAVGHAILNVANIPMSSGMTPLIYLGIMLMGAWPPFQFTSMLWK